MTSDDEVSDRTGTLPEQRAGAAMRQARESGDLSLRQMAKLLGYHSHTSLSAYELGAKMPTEKAIAGYEQVLGLRPGALMGVLEDARVERHGDAWSKRRVHIPTEFAGERPSQPSGQATKRGMLFRGRWAMIAGCAGLFLLVALIVVVLTNRSQADISVRDGSDPEVMGCAADAVTMNQVGVYDPPEHLVGFFQLRSSVRCGASWGRFKPARSLPTKPSLTLEINTYRPADGAVSKFHVSYDGLKAYGNMLVSRHECVYATLTLLRQNKLVTTPVETMCATAPAG